MLFFSMLDVLSYVLIFQNKKIKRTAGCWIDSGERDRVSLVLGKAKCVTHRATTVKGFFWLFV